MDTTEKVKSRWTRSFFTGLSTSGDDERDICDICHKDFASPSNLSLHRSTHVIERRYKCEPCQVSFHSQGHLQKHKRSSAHETRVEMTQAFGVPTSDNPRPYGCPECDTAFRKHGHLAKHLRSKSHITKLEANGLIPTGTFAILDKCGQELKEKLVTTNCELSLISLRKIAMQLFADRPELANMAGSPERRMMLSPSSTRVIRMASNSSPPCMAAGTSLELSGSCHTSSADDSSMSAGALMGPAGMMSHHYINPPLDYGGPLGMGMGLSPGPPTLPPPLAGPLQQQPISMIDSHTGSLPAGLPPPPPLQPPTNTTNTSHQNPYELDFAGPMGVGSNVGACTYVPASTHPSIIHGSHSPSTTSHMIVHSPGLLHSPGTTASAPPPPLEIAQQVATSASNFLPTHHSQTQMQQQRQPPLPPPSHHHHHQQQQQQQQQQQFHQAHHLQQRAPIPPLQQQQHPATHFVNATSAPVPISSPPANYHLAGNNNLQYRSASGPFKLPPVTTQHFSQGNQAAAMQQPDIL